MFEIIERSATNPFGFVLNRGDDGRPGIIWLHGQGGAGDGSKGALERNLNDGNIPMVLQQGVQSGKFWLFAPQMSGDWTQAEVSAMFAYIAANGVAVNPAQMNLAGFSLGGREVIRWMMKSLENAKKIACAVSIAPASITIPATGTTGFKNIADAKVACWFHVNSGDTTCPPSNVNSIVAAINNLNPIVKAVKTIYNAPGHGAEIQACGLTPPSAPGGEGLTASKVTMYQWIEMNKQGTPVAVPEITGLVAYAGEDRSVTSPQIKLDGTGSKNYVQQGWGWELIEFPDGVNKWTVITGGGGWITADATLPKPGKYTFRLTVQDAAGTKATDTIAITYSTDTLPPPPPPPPPVRQINRVSVDWENLKVEIGFNDSSKITINKDGTQST